MFEITVANSIIFALAYWVIFYIGFSTYSKKLVKLEWRKFLYYVSLFSLFGVVGEAFTNTLYEYIFGAPLWEYRLFPAHEGDITYLFFFVWGTLGFYTYLRDACLRKKSNKGTFASGLILGTEAIFIELLLNVPFYLMFGTYIFYYFPADLGLLSHFSTLQVVPFYMIVGFVTGHLIKLHDRLNYTLSTNLILAFYWMVIITFVFF